MSIKKVFRIIRVWSNGKLTYAKRYRKWMKGRLLRDLIELTPRYYQELVNKYGGEVSPFIIESFGMMMPKEPEKGESALKVDITDVQETETGKVFSWTVNPQHPNQ